MDPVVTKITPFVRQLQAPPELRRLQAWLMWRVEYEPGNPKGRKIAYWANGQKRFGKNGSPGDRAKLVTFEAAKEAAAKNGFEGVGFAPLPEWGVVALDFDACVGEDQQLPAEIENIVSQTYTEYSPSGTGLRAFFKGDVGNRKTLAKDWPKEGWGFEVFSTAGWVTFTGQSYWTTDTYDRQETVAPIDSKVEALCLRRFGEREHAQVDPDDPFAGLAPKLDLSWEECHALVFQLDPSMRREPWVKVGMALHHEFDGSYEGFELWDQWSSGGDTYPGTDKLEEQWESFTRRAAYNTGRPTTMATVKRMVAEVRRQKGESTADLDALVAEIKDDLGRAEPTTWGTPDDFDGKFRLQPVAQFVDRPPPRWIIKGVLPDADVGVLYGASGSGKSFITIDMLFAIAQGIPWRGRRVKQGRVLYIAAEGADDVALRMRAYAEHNMLDLQMVPVTVMSDLPNFLDQDDISEILKAIRAAGGFDVIAVDTWAQVTAGADENSSQDMGKALRYVRKIADATGAMTLLVHHSGKDVSRGARGWSGMRAAADVELEVIRDEETDERTLRTSKQKGGDDSLRWLFRLEKVFLGEDDDGDPIASLVVLEIDTPEEEPETRQDDAPIEQDLTEDETPVSPQERVNVPGSTRFD